MEVIHISQFQLAFLSLARYPSNKAFCCLRICSLFSKFCLSLAYSSSITYSAFTRLCSFRFSTRSFANSLSCFETTAVGCLLSTDFIERCDTLLRDRVSCYYAF
jgi:hypothetical protein